METEVKVVEGMQFERGYLSNYFVNRPEKMECELTNVAIFATDKKISVLKDLMPVLEIVSKQGRSLLVISEVVEGEALSALVVNSARGALRVAAVKAPNFGDHRKEMLEDIAALTGGMAILDEKGIKFEGVRAEMLGHAERVIVNRDHTIISSGSGSAEAIEARVKKIRAQMEEAESEFDKTQFQERLARLTGGVAVLYVGAATEVEMKNKKDLIDDALSATRAAIEEGIVPGGGVAYIRAIEALEGLKGKNEDETIGIQIIKRAIEEPLRQIVDNAGMEASVIVQKVKEGEADYGFNAQTLEYENLIETGVIDPTKVSRVALESAASVAGMFLTTESVMINKRSEGGGIPMMIGAAPAMPQQ
jgi:chaperonin GroEL